MPDPSSSFDDPFADLFAQLPDSTRREAGDSRAAASPDAAAPSDDAASSAQGVPSSRRAAREQAQRQTGGLPTQASPSVPPTGSAAYVAPAGSMPPVPPLPVRSAPATAPPASGSGWPFDSQTTTRPDSPREPITPPARQRTAPAATATLDDLFSAEVQEDRVAAPSEKKRERRGGCLVALAIVVLIFGGITFGVLWALNTYGEQVRETLGWGEPVDFEAGLATGEALITIAEGDGGQAISQTLFDEGVTRTPEAFYEMLIAQPSQPTFFPGVYRLQQSMTSLAALEALEDPANKLENSALLPEGLRVEQSVEIIATGLGLPLEDVEAAVVNPADYGVDAETLEGWLFPAMYTFDPGVTAPQAIQTMVDRAVQSLDAAGVPVERRQEILTIASIIEREARFEEDFYRVSRVIQNRLDPSNQETFGLLQMDSTAQYGVGEFEGSVSSSENALTDDNPWNTYVNPGLPIGPIANPGDTAIDAAMKPAEGPWLYFVTVNLDTGETVFTSTYEEHLGYVDEWLQWCEENPDSGCTG